MADETIDAPNQISKKQARKNWERAYNKKNREKKRLALRAWHKRNPEKMRIYSQRSYYSNPKKNNARGRAYYLAHLEEGKRVRREWYIRNRQSILEKNHAKRGDPEFMAKERAARQRWRSSETANSIPYRLRQNCRRRIRRALKGMASPVSSAALIGCSVEVLKIHLESLFQPGMSWENWGPKGWHIDHILPLASYDLTDLKQLRVATHYTNLQPLWWRDNISKGGKIL